MDTKASPELLEQLHDAGAEAVQAIFHLQSAKGSKAPLTDDEVRRISSEVLERVASSTGEPAIRSNVLSSLRTLVVEARPEFLRSLIQQPEVASAFANRTKESPVIAPRRKRPVD